MQKKKPPKKKVKQQPKPKRRFQPAKPAPGVITEGPPTVQPPAKPSVSPGEVGHWGHDNEWE